MLKIIKETNGDILGVILFIFLIIHFATLKNKTLFTSILLISCLFALIVDIIIVLKYFFPKDSLFN